jgi:hypothetical protein
MRIDLTPQRLDATLTLARSGDTLVINGTAHDFAGVPEGAVLPAEAVGSPWIVGPVTRTDGRLRLTLILPHGPNAPPETRFPASLDLTADGPVPLPPFNQPEPEAQA